MTQHETELREAIVKLIEAGDHVHKHTPCKDPLSCRWMLRREEARRLLVDHLRDVNAK